MKPSEIAYYLLHPFQLRAMIQWKLWHTPLHERDRAQESETLQRCYHFLDLTSRSFSAVIQELTPELRLPIALFYLILRGLDTIEDDMTIPLEKKEPLLRTFDQILDQKGWTFNENGPNEKDRQLLVEFDIVIEEFSKIKEPYRVIIKEITKRMGDGMADYANNAEHNINGVNTIEDYDLYCHYVAGLVGLGLTKLFVEAKLANPVLLEREYLSNSMGLFLQKVNITRDFREDLEDGRRFWPKQIWSKYVDNFADLAKPENAEIAMNCSSEMVLNALGHADECLFYLAGIKDQSVFNFCAIPQVMAIATNALIFRNPDIFQKNVKIPKGEACELLLEMGNLRSVSAVFRKYLRIIHKKNTPKDPNYLAISIAIGKIEQWIEGVFPTPLDPEIVALQRQAAATGETVEQYQSRSSKLQLMALLAMSITTLTLLSLTMMFGAWLLGARFDIAFVELRKSFGTIMEAIQKNVSAAAVPSPAGMVHGEL